MKRRDFLKGLSAIVPAALLTQVALPETTETIEPEQVEPDTSSDIDSGIWFWNGGVHHTDPVYCPSSFQRGAWEIVDVSKNGT